MEQNSGFMSKYAVAVSVEYQAVRGRLTKPRMDRASFRKEAMKVPKKGENIYKRKDGRWEGRYIRSRDELTGKPKYGYVYAEKYSDCKRMKAQAEAGLRPAAARSKATVGECLDLWLEERRADADIHDSTLRQYERTVEKHLKPQLGEVRADRVTAELLGRFRSRQLHSGRLDGAGGLSKSVVSGQLVILRGALELAHQQGLIPAPPETARQKCRRGSKEEEVRVFDRTEQGRIEAALCAQAERREEGKAGLCMGVLFSLYTGLRVGELGGLQWRDLDFTNRTAAVRRTFQRIPAPEGAATKTILVIGPPKTATSRRVIPLMDGLWELMGNYRDSLPATRRGAGDPVFPYKGKNVEPRLFQLFFKRLLAQAGVEDANFHALRHTFATRCLENGMDMKSLSEVLGHADPVITAKKYAHSVGQHKAACMNRLQFMAPAHTPSQIAV